MRSVSLAFRESINKGFTPYFEATAVFPNGYFSDSTHTSVTLKLVGKLPESSYDKDYVDKWGYISDFLEDTVEYQSGTSSSGNFDVGGCVISALNFTLNNNNGKFDDLDFTGAYLIPRIGVRELSFKHYLFTEAAEDDKDEAHLIATEYNEPMVAEMETGNNYSEVEWLPMGTFYFVSHKQVGYTIECETYDRLKFMDEYYILKDDKITFPCTAYDLIYKITSNRGIVLANEQFHGYGTVLPVAPDNDITERQALSYVAQMCGCYAKMGVVGSSDRLLIQWYDLNNAFTSKRRFSHSLDTHNVTITGVRVHDANNADTSYLYPTNSESGDTYYTLDISGNPWIVGDAEDGSVQSNLEAIASQIAGQVVGLTFTPGSETIFTDPSIESGDVLRVYGDNTKDYRNFIITNLDLKLGVTETITCDGQSSEQNDLRQSAAQTAVNQAKAYLGQKLNHYQTMSNLFARLAKESLGTYKIEETQSDGSKITYYASVPSLRMATSSNPAIVWRLSSDAVQVCDKYVYGSEGNQWTGYTADGQALVNTLTAVGIHADWITGNLTDGASNYWNLDNGTFYLGGTDTHIQRKEDGTLEILASSVKSDWVYAGDIKASQITSGKISADYIDAENLNVKSATTAGSVACENLTGTKIKGKTIEGGKFTTSSVWNSEVNENNCVTIDGNWIQCDRIWIGATSAGTVNIGFSSDTNGQAGEGLVCSRNFATEPSYKSYSGDFVRYSDRRLKKNIRTIPVEESKKLIFNARPVSYVFKADKDKKVEHGFVAQEIEPLISDHSIVSGGVNGGYYSLSYEQMIADMVNVIQDQEKRIIELEGKVANIQ